MDSSDIRIVLLGKTGAGKSSAGNTILGGKPFPMSPIIECQVETGEFEGQTLAVVDTPGLLNTRLSEEEVMTEISKCTSSAPPGPYVFLFVLQPKAFTKEDPETIKTILQTFGEATRYTVVLFTRGDDLEADGVNIDEIICDNPALSESIHQFEDRYHVFNNRDRDPSQVRKLMKKINTMVQRTEGSIHINKILEGDQRARKGMKRPADLRQNTEMTPAEPKRRAQRENPVIQANPADGGGAVGGDAEKPNIRIVLLGKTGAGKSSSGNTILGKKAFETPFETTECQKKTREFEHQTLTVVDTPGLLNSKDQQEVMREITRCYSLAAPGPHVLLIVLEAGRFTKEQQDTVTTILQMFGEEAARYTMVLFTRGDNLEEGNIEDFISKNSALSDFIHRFEKRYHVFKNRDKDPSQVRELLEKINTMIQRNGGGCYTNEMFREEDRAIRKDMKQPADLRDNTNMKSAEPQRCTQGENQVIQTSPADDGAAVGGGIKAGVGAVGGTVRDAAKVAKQDLRMVLVGTTGVGKSSTGNTILRRKAFKTGLSASTECEMEKGEFEGQNLAVVDTPGLLDTDLPEEKVMTEITKCISLTAPGPHVFLFVLQGGRLIEDDQQTVRIIQKMFGEEATRYTVVLFTRGDSLKADGDTIENIMSKDKALSDLISQCGGRYQLFDNRDENPSQVTELLKKINTMTQKNGGSCYTNEMFKEAERVNNEEIQRLQRENPNMTPEEARKYVGSRPPAKKNQCVTQ